MSQNIHAEMRKILLNVRSLRVFLRESICESSFELMKEASEKFKAVVDEHREEYEAQKIKLEEREKKRLELISLVKEEGFDLSTFFVPVTAGQKKKKGKSSGTPLEPKYQFTENGETKFWAGVGRKPNPIKKAMEAGGSLNDFLIK